MMTIGATCESCGAAFPDADAARFMNMKTAGYHVIFRCACGVELTERRVAFCALATSRAMLDAYKRDLEQKGSP